MLVAVSPVHPTRPARGGPPPEAIHPALWRAAGFGRSRAPGLATGFAALDAELPGGGWPGGLLTELLLPQPGVGEWRLLAPTLAALQRGQGEHGAGSELPRSVMLFDPPARPCPWTLAALGLDAMQLFVVQGRGQPRRTGRTGRSGQGAPRARLPLPAADTLWALEQALASGHLGAALAWLPPRLPADALRRLQLAAQAHPGPVFLFREAEARSRPSAAPLRLLLTPGPSSCPDGLRVHILKRRGPLPGEPLLLALPPVLGSAARERVRDAVVPRPTAQPGALASVAQGAPSAASARPLSA
ncbi:translesion DNA synthesis-associated protein ImuA [Rubrivivax albus]|uniref:Translesion DNA synthesis-associated protein ImuA n=1 Tax=Rubrivivax albus TaxID=2499835 RepID=A0A3S2U7F2_9BURK|nr:translesion DNA synthesis-associated protein ImuA [Rubrivivax albus]